MDAIVTAKELTKTYKSGNVSFNAVDGVDFCIDGGELTVILGASGAGKTTLLNLIGGMDELTSGTLTVDGVDLGALSKKQMTVYRRHNVGFVFQFYNLMPNLTALENVELAAEICKDAYSPTEILAKVGLTERAKNFPSQLSGGEQQRVSIARAVAKNPKILLCDEPTGALDYQTGKSILKVLQDMSRIEKKTVIIVTHNAAIEEMADRIIHVKSGRIESVMDNASPKDAGEIEW